MVAGGTISSWKLWRQGKAKIVAKPPSLVPCLLRLPHQSKLAESDLYSVSFINYQITVLYLFIYGSC